MHLAAETVVRDTWHMDESSIPALVKSLRKRLGLSHELVADRGGMARETVSKIESGKNKLSGAKSRRELAKGLGLSPAALDRYLAGETPLEETVASAGHDRAQRAPEEAAPGAVASSVAAFHRALSDAFREGSYVLDDLDAVRAVLSTGAAQIAEFPRLDEAARAWLRGAARLRLNGRPVTVATLAWASALRDEELNAEGIAQLASLGGRPPTAPVRTPPRGIPAVPSTVPKKG